MKHSEIFLVGRERSHTAHSDAFQEYTNLDNTLLRSLIFAKKVGTAATILLGAKQTLRKERERRMGERMGESIIAFDNCFTST